MGVSIQQWRAKIGCFSQPRVGYKDCFGANFNSDKAVQSDLSISIAIRLCLFILLVAQCVERNPGPTSDLNRGRGGNIRGGRGRGGTPTAPPMTTRSSQSSYPPFHSQPQHDRRESTGHRSSIESDQRSLNNWLHSDPIVRQDSAASSHTSHENFEPDAEAENPDVRSLLLEIRREVKTTNRKFDILENSVKELQADNVVLKEQNADLKREVSSLSSKVTTLETQLQASNKKQDALETLTKKQNLKISNLTLPTTDDDPRPLEDIVIESLNRALPLNETSASFDVIYKLPSKTTPTPILLRCSSLKIRDRILTAFRTARKSNHIVPFRVGEDLPVNTSKARSLLYPFFKESIEQGKRAFFKHDRLVVNGETYTFDENAKAPVLADK